MDLAAEVGEELAGGDIPVTVAPGAFLPAGQVVEDVAVVGVGEGVVMDGGGDEPGGGFGSSVEGDDIFGAIPGVTDAAGVGGGIEARTPGPSVRPDLGTAAAGSDVGLLAGGEGSGFFNPDDVVFETEIGIDVFFTLIMAGDNAGAVGESQKAARGREI